MGESGRNRSRAGKRVALVVLTVLFGLVGIEIVLRAAVPHFRGSHQHPSRILRDDFLTAGRLGQHDPQLGWVLRPSRVTTNRAWEFAHPIRTNSRGMRDDEVAYERGDAVRRIVLLGDSFAMGDGVKRRFSFPDLLEQLMRGTEVINLGVSGYGTDQELLTYRGEGRKYEADYVLLALTLANDLENNAASMQYGMSKPWFTVGQQGLELRGVPVPERAPAAVAADADPASTGSPHAVHDALDRHSALYATVFERLSELPRVRAHWEAKGLIYPQLHVFYHGQVGVLKNPPDAGLEKAWQITAAILAEWQREVRANDTVPVLVLLPSHLQVYTDVWERTVKKYGLAAAAYDPEYPNRRMVDFCRANGLACIDLLPEFRAEAESGRTLYYKRNPHWNRSGHLLAAQIIMKEIEVLETRGTQGMPGSVHKQ